MDTAPGAVSWPEKIPQTLRASQTDDGLGAPFVSTGLEALWSVGSFSEVAGEFPFVAEQESKDTVSHVESDSVDSGFVVLGFVQFCPTAEQHGKPERDGALVKALSARAQPQ